MASHPVTDQSPSRDAYSYPPRGMSRGEAARYIGVGTTKFDEMVADKRMPKPKRIDGRTVWDRIQLDAAFSDLPDDGVNMIDELLSRQSRTGKEVGVTRSFVSEVTDPAGLAERWGCSARHVRNIIARGELPAFGYGRTVRIKWADIEAFELSGGSPSRPKE